MIEVLFDVFFSLKKFPLLIKFSPMRINDEFMSKEIRRRIMIDCFRVSSYGLQGLKEGGGGGGGGLL